MMIMMKPLFAQFFLLLYLFSSPAIGDHQLGLTHGRSESFVSDPKLEASRIVYKNKTEDTSLLYPGYIFISPYGSGNFPPQMIDNNGDLIWCGQKQYNGSRAQSFSVCDWRGEKGTHLCWGQKGPSGEARKTTNRIFRSDYTPVNDEFGKVDHSNYPNLHEFNMLPGGHSFLRTVLYKKAKDLRPYKGPKEGFIIDCCFQEISVTDDSELFNWCYLDHLPEHETQLYLDIPENKVNLTSTMAGRGTFSTPWDFCHMNAIDKSGEGDYIVSARHLDQIIKIAGIDNVHNVKPGKVVWRLGGRNSDMIVDEDAHFSRQHHVRFVSVRHDRTTISLFNNAWEGVNKPSSNSSAGLVIEVNNVTMTAHLKHAYPHPNGSLSAAQGSMQLLPNGNALIGWGAAQEFSEFTRDGKLLTHAQLSQGPTNYRTFKYLWEGHPKTKPKLLAYSQYCENCPLVAYVSWNGATLIRSWRFHVSTTSMDGPWIIAGTWERSGFETNVTLSSKLLSKVTGFVPWVSVEALDEEGNVLGSTITRTFVPRIGKAGLRCGEHYCHNPDRFGYGRKYSRAGQCGKGIVPSVLVLLFVIIIVEFADHFMSGGYPGFVHVQSKKRKWRPKDTQVMEAKERLLSEEGTT